MHDFLPVVFVLGLVLAVITVVGHGIWALLAILFRGGASKPSSKQYKCPICRHVSAASTSRCDWCGQPVNPRLADELDDLEAVERQLYRFQSSGAMKPDVVAKLLKRMREYRQRLLAAPAEKPRAAPVVAALVEPKASRPADVASPPIAARPVSSARPERPTRLPTQEDNRRTAGQASSGTPRASSGTPRTSSGTQVGTGRASSTPPVAPTINAPRAKPWADVLAGFIEERNIRWAEFVGVLVGGLMIVGASLALVISFWDTLQATYLKFLIFVGYSSAIFGVGLFAFHRWKLHATGRGLLTISTLLVPLNFVAMASLSPDSWSWPTATVEIASLAIFTVLSALAADVIVPGRRGSMVLATVGNSIVILLGTRLLGPNGSDSAILAANLVPAILLAASMIGQILGVAGRHIDGRCALEGSGQSTIASDAAETFTLLGMSAFAAAVAIGVIAAKTGTSLYLPLRVHCLAPAFALAAWPVLASGLRTVRGMADQPNAEGYRTAAIMVALLGIVLQFASMALMWPQPLGLIVVGLVNVVGLFFVAVRYRFPVVHAGVIACLAVIWLAGFQLASNPWLRDLQYGTFLIHYPGLAIAMLRSVLTAHSITSLAGLFLLFAGIAVWLVGKSHRHARPYAIACVATGVIALLAITMRGFLGVHADRLYTAANFAFYGAASVIVATRSRRTVFSYIGWNLLGVAPFWTLQLPLMANIQSSLALAGCLGWLAAVWLVLAWIHRSRDFVMAAQCLLTAATVVATTSWLQTRSWVHTLPDDLFGARSLQAYGAALALLSLGWIIARLAARGKPIAEQLLSLDELSFDWFVRHLVVVVQWLVACASILPCLPQELWRFTAAHGGGSIPNAVGPMGWLSLTMLAVVWIAALWERWGTAELLGSVLLASTGSCLLAGGFAPDAAVASMLRWTLAACFAVYSIGIWQRVRLAQWCQRFGMRIRVTKDGPLVAQASLIATTVIPVILLTLLAAWVQIDSVAPLGPVVDSFFHRIGPRVSYFVPLLLVIVTLVGHAVRERAAGYVFSAGLVAEMAAALGYGLTIALARDPMRTFGAAEFITLVQCITITAAAWAPAWMAARRWLYEHPSPSRHCPYLTTQLGLAGIANAVLLLTPVLQLLREPSHLSRSFGEIGSIGGWTALMLAAAAWAWQSWRTVPERTARVLGATLLGIAVLVSCDMAHFNTANVTFAPWLEYHILMTGWATAAAVMLGVGLLSRWPRLFPAATMGNWVTGIAIASVALALIYADRSGMWWSLGVIAAMGVTVAVLAIWQQRPFHVMFSGLLWNAVGIVAWLAWGNRHDRLQFTYVNVICLACASAVWTAIQIGAPRAVPHIHIDRRPLVFAHVAAAVGLAILAAVAALAVFILLGGHTPHVHITPMAWTAIGSLAAAISLTLWDRLARHTFLGLYVVGFTALGMAWAALEPAPRELCWRMSTELTGYMLVTAVIGWLISRFVAAVEVQQVESGRLGATAGSPSIPRASLWNLLRIPMDQARWSANWFMGCQAVLSCVAAVVAAWVSIDFAFDPIGRNSAFLGLSGRMAGVSGALMLLGGTIVMAWQCKLAEWWRLRWQYAALAAGLLLNVSTGWAAMDATSGPAAQAPWLHRSVSLLVASAMMILVCGVGLRRFLPKAADWIASGRQAVPYFAGLTLLVLAAVLGQEAYLFSATRAVPMAGSAVAVVSGTLALLIVTCIAVAVLPQFDPFALSDRGRQAYVYAAEGLVVLTGLHLRMTMPWLFQLGIIERYWMLLVMAGAFAGAGLSELFRRRRLPVLSEPLERTALLLPLLPAVGFWFADAPDSVLGIVGRTPMLWFLVSAFYGIMAYVRRSGICVLLSVLTANVGLWVILQMSDIGLLEHPQLWLIPIALAALVAEYLNHDRLSATQSAGWRYAALSVVYLSSTADMFIAGLGTDWRLPIVLMLLSVAGVFAGLLLRIRSFLLLGIVFLVLDIVAMIWYAAVDLEQTWLWYVCLIALGAAIIAVFAMFEKRRNDLLAAVQKLKQWQR